jgi:hypothetical protein
MGIKNGNICFFKYWNNNGEIIFSKWPYEFNPKLMNRIVQSFRMLNEKLKK